MIALASTFAVNAQTNLTSQYGNSVDTVVNTATKYLNSPVLSGYKKVVTVQFIGVKISGTVAGTAQLQASLDGTYFYNVGSAFTLTDVASQTTSFKVTDFGDLYLRVAVTGSGTMSNKIYAKFLSRNP